MACPPPGYPPPGVKQSQPDPPTNIEPCVCVPTVLEVTSTQIVPVRPRRCKYVQPERPKSYAPNRQFQPPETQMSDSTTYRKSYLPVEIDKNPPIRRDDNLCLGKGPFSKDSVHTLSYKGYKYVLPPFPIIPCNHNLLGSGPFQDVTTNKHDYVKKPLQRQNKIITPNNLYCSEFPMSDKTTNRLSYMPVDLSSVRVIQFRPIPAIEKAEGPFEKNTVHKLSFMPWEPQGPIDMPWAEKTIFRPPTLKMSTHTVNKLSYAPPGTFVECEPGDPGCIPCQDDFYPNPPRDVCSQPCCCPTAGC